MQDLPKRTKTVTDVARDFGQLLSELRDGDITITRYGQEVATITGNVPKHAGCETTSISSLISNSGRYLDRVRTTLKPIVLLRRGRPVAALIPMNYQPPTKKERGKREWK